MQKRMAIDIRNLDWSLIAAFVAVAEHGSLSAAARAMGSTQPTLGRQIKALEKQLGTPVFQRTPRGFDLTDTGVSLLPSAMAMRDAANDLALTVAGKTNSLAGTVRITASVATSLYHLPRIIADIRAAEPDIAIELVPSDDTRNLLYREADIAVRMYEPTQLDLVTRYLGDFTITMCAAASYIARHGAPKSPEAFLAHDFVGYDADDRMIKGFQQAGFPVDRDFFKVRCDDNAGYLELVRAGCGIGFAQHRIVEGDPTLVAIETDFELPTLPVWLTAHEAMRQSPRIKRVWDLLAAGLKPLVS